MARYTAANCRLCRREGAKLFLKGRRCFTDKCAFEKRDYAPGQRSRYARRKVSNYGIQLREKQKVRRAYGIFERQFRGYYEKAARAKGITGENLLLLLERRLDNIVYRLGFAPSRKAARQLVRHGHFMVNDRKVDIPSYQVNLGDVIQVQKNSRDFAAIHDSLKDAGRRPELSWLRLDKVNLRGELLQFPSREDIGMPFEEQLIVALYSK
ncbi:MAG: 30S ribosomal protein S4 [candidate division Zixibacteria bacterium SM23_81]|nr:MAG: 30S ribosomal protein S4 [candidate division Zixibacteria bacterium SM23_81]